MLNIDDRLIKEVSPKIRPNALSVLLAIAIHVSKKDNRCFPSHGRLMQLTGLGRDAVYNALEVLKENGLLTSYQGINTETKQFGKRTFKLTTRFIKIFLDVEDAEPLTENPDTENPFTANPDTENQETKRLNESKRINKKEQLNKTPNQENPLSGPYKKVDEIFVETFDPETPGCVIVEMLTVEANEKNQPPSPGAGAPKTKPEKSGRVKQQRGEPHIHAENENVFAHFTDPNKAKTTWAEWLKYKWGEHRQKYKTGESELIALRKIFKTTGGDSGRFTNAVEHSISNLYKGIFEPKEQISQNGRTDKATQQRTKMAAYLIERKQRAIERGDFGAMGEP